MSTRTDRLLLVGADGESVVVTPRAVLFRAVRVTPICLVVEVSGVNSSSNAETPGVAGTTPVPVVSKIVPSLSFPAMRKLEPVPRTLVVGEGIIVNFLNLQF